MKISDIHYNTHQTFIMLSSVDKFPSLLGRKQFLYQVYCIYKL